MTIDLEERIRRAAQLLDDEAIRAHEGPADIRLARLDVGAPRSVAVGVAAACMLLAGLVGVFLVATRNPSSVPAMSDSPTVDGGPASSAVAATAPVTTTALAVSSVPATVAAGTEAPATTGPSVLVPPAATLPPMADVSTVVPPTVLGTAPTDWYRLQPDLDVAWYSDGGAASMLCFRTPAGQKCQLDRFAPTTLGGGPIGVYSVDDQLLVLTLDPASTVTITFDNGQTLTSPVEREAETGWGVARIQLPRDAAPQGLAMIFDFVQGDSTPPVTSPPTSEPAPTIAG